MKYRYLEREKEIRDHFWIDIIMIIFSVYLLGHLAGIEFRCLAADRIFIAAVCGWGIILWHFVTNIIKVFKAGMKAEWLSELD